jgi:hypothetical protein
MQGERKFTKYIKVKDHSDQLQRALNNLIKLGLGGEYKQVVALSEALIILNLNTIPSLGILLCFLQREKASINADIGKELLSYFCD